MPFMLHVSSARKAFAAAVLVASFGLPPAAEAATAPTPPVKAAPPAPATGPVGSPTQQKFGSWTFACPAADVAARVGCVILQQISEPLSRRVVFVAMLQYDQKGQLMGAFRVPPGVFINRGIVIKSAPDAEGARVEYERCDQRECQAVFPVTKDMVKQWSAAKSATVTLALTSGKNADVDLPLDGFSGAVQALSAAPKPAAALVAPN
ncbi:MAG TPA: invasion associated locus B family protein [Bauldia sp.]|nr:invasion associated locus B family protein [Bauldia sp.]